MSITFIDAKTFRKPKTYFTEYDRVTYTQVNWDAADVDQIELDLERKVKLLALIKGVVVISTSHLYESDIARDFLRSNPILLKEGIIVPALISKYKDFSDFLTSKRQDSKENNLYLGSDKDDVNSMLSDCVDSVFKWDVNQTVAWFKQRLLRDLKDERSVLRFNLANVPSDIIAKTASRIKDLEFPSRSEIYKIAHTSGNNILWTRLCDYTDFIYYLAGAHAVDSEGVLPQDNLIDFSITDLLGDKPRLSEYEIFYRIFIRIIENKTQKKFPIEILDLLTFKDIVSLRKSLYHGGFVIKYNQLLEKTKRRVEIADADQLVLSLDEICQFEEELFEIFTNTVVAEINQIKKINKEKAGLKVLTSVGSLLSFYGTAESVTQIAANTLSLIGYKEQINQVEEGIRRNMIKMEEFVDRSSMEKKPLLLKFLAEINKKYTSKLIDISDI